MKTYAKNTALLNEAIEVLKAEHPCTLRQLYYRLMSRGALRNAQSEYSRLGTLATRAREAGLINRRWIVDHVRSTLKPSSWTALVDFADTVRDAYRKDYWASLDHHVAVFVEKDAVAGTIQPVTAANDVALHVCRGYASVSFVGEIADEWRQIQKPIYANYLGDFDPSGFDIERDLQEKIARYSGRIVIRVPADYDWSDDTYNVKGSKLIIWQRLGVRPTDFDEFDLLRLPIKASDTRAKKFIEEHGDAGCEIDAIPPSELRRRVEEAIDLHIDVDRWNALIQTEEAERATMRTVLASLGNQTQSRSSLDEGEVAR